MTAENDAAANLSVHDLHLSGLPPFRPRFGLSNSHLQTILGNFLPRRNHLPLPLAQFVEVSPAHGSQTSSRVLCECHWQLARENRACPAVILLHGLEGSSRSQYVVGNADKFWRAGFSVIRMNMRNCGGTENLSPTLYHSGLSSDVEQVARYFVETQDVTSLSLVGYSMGGNLVLKLAGELGSASPRQLRSVVGVSPAIDLAASAAALHEPQNRIYERRFLRSLLRRFRRKAALFPHAFDTSLANNISSIREFDDRITALYSGFKSADDYYARSSAAKMLDQISVPTLLIHSSDDPFVRITNETRLMIAANPQITLLETSHGGHCAFLASPSKSVGDDGYWAEDVALHFVLSHA